jgi:hypothetical protein
MNKIFLVLSFVSFALFAQEAVEEKSAEKPCKEDREKLCKDVKPGQGRIIKCLKENEDKLSPVCKSHFEKKTAEAKENHGKCKEDRKKFCKDVKPGEGRIIKCLKDNLDKLAPDCKEVIASKKI